MRESAPAGRAYLLSFGYPADPAALTWPKRKGWKTLDEVVHWERWENHERPR